MSVTVKIEGLERVLRKLDPRLLEVPMTRFLERTAITIQNRMAERSPVDTGRLRSSLAYEIDKDNPPLWAKVGTNVTHQGVSYPRVLEESPIHHYQGTPRKGQPTKGWFSKSVRDMASRTRGFVKQLGRDIQRAWGR